MPNADWMSKLTGNPCIARLAIPGTHDSGACQWTVKPMTRAQTLSIPEQLAAGVRALDIRCGATYGSEGTWTGMAMDVFGGGQRADIQELLGEERTTYNVFHGPFDQGISIADVVAQVAEFLEQNKSESVLLLLKQEGGSVDISEAINKIVDGGLGHKLFRLSERVGQQVGKWPNLDECRGKALVFSRLGKPGKNHYNTRGWPDNPGSEEIGNVDYHRIQADTRSIVIQDLYKSPQVPGKKSAVDNALQQAKDSRTGWKLYINFTSFVWKPWEPVWSGSTHMTPHLRSKSAGAGVICVDAITDDLAKHIIGWNQ